MQTLKKILRAVIFVIIAMWVLFFGIIIYALISDYKPDEKEIVSESTAAVPLNDTVNLSFLTWNIGYCGLDREMDFFYDGGTKVRPPADKVSENFEAISNFIRSNDSIDFILLQEVDRKSKRSYRLDEYDGIVRKNGPVSAQFAPNYDVFFVPVPASSPMGKVFSGIAIMGKTIPSSSVRYAFPGKYGFPKQLFMLDRCFLVNRYPLAGGHELVLINTHNEAFDPGDIRRAQMEYLKEFISGEYEKGNYVIAGGDWNQCPPEFTPGFSHNLVNKSQMMLESGYLPEGWHWAFDKTVPSERSVTEAYDPEITTTTVIDFFLLSPNIESISVKCINLEFEHSDHNPVIMTARLVH